MDPLATMAQLGLGGTSASGPLTGFQQSLASLSSTPGSPAKAFPPPGASQAAPGGFNPMQSITSQLQGE